MKKEDTGLIRKAKKDPKQYGKLYEKYGRRVYQYAFRRVGGSKEIAEDIVQDTFTRAFRALSCFRIQNSSYLSYLLRIARNLVINRFRKKGEFSVLQLPEQIASQEENLFSVIAKKMSAENLQKVLGQLSLEQQQLVHWRYDKGLSYKEIAYKTGSTENAVKLKVFRIRKHIEKVLRSDPTLFQD